MSTFTFVVIIKRVMSLSTRCEPCLSYSIEKSARVSLLAYLAIGMSGIAINVVLDDTGRMHIPDTTTIGTGSSRSTCTHPPPLRHAHPQSNMPALSWHIQQCGFSSPVHVHLSQINLQLGQVSSDRGSDPNGDPHGLHVSL